ncbi:MAG: hypothetical protein A2355_03825 [Spirochaetes bacterium RIFOXYB1_FULL_32_8]|nr:MAG: hypothetical protein A2355_03825 [Spirochaetes bacterium RIFOXYB1_FULL_32_8]
MDIFLDYTLEKLQLCFNDGFYGRFHPKFGTENFHNVVIKTSTHYEYESKLPLFNIYKMHGSVNWKNGNNKIPNDNTVSYDYGLEVLSSIYNLPLDQNDFIALKYNEGDKDDSKNIQMLMSEKKELTTSHSSFLDAYNKLLIINPTKQKLAITTLELTFYELLRMYSNYLERENSILFVIGFSFADEHIREITKRVAASNPTLLIIIFAYTKNAIDNKMNETQNIKIIYPDNDDCFYSLKEINDNFFKKLSNDLSGKTSSTYTGENLNG